MPRLISIIIPVWNHGKELLACLESLERQTYTGFEVIAVDDGSTDGVEKMLEGKAFPFPFAFVRLAENRGAPAARNEGARRAEGDWLLFLDADAELRPTMVHTMAKTLEEHPEAAFVYSDFYFGRVYFQGQHFSFDALKKKNYIHTSSLLLREAFPGFDESLTKFQDWDLWLTIAKRGGVGVWIPEPLFFLKPRRTGISQWVPSFAYRLPWPIFGWTPKVIKKYRDAEAIIRTKHHL